MRQGWDEIGLGGVGWDETGLGGVGWNEIGLCEFGSERHWAGMSRPVQSVTQMTQQWSECIGHQGLIVKLH